MLRFGTDGVRGRANVVLTPELALALGRAAARVLAVPGSSGRRGRFLVGRDTRRSGPLLQAALSAGLASEGAEAVDLGVLPTPGVALLSANHRAPGAVVSASHNPFADNGVKLFAAGGLKLDDEVERRLEAELVRLVVEGGDGATGAAAGGAGDADGGRPAGDAVGTLVSWPDAGTEYQDHLVAALDGRTLAGLRVAVDCANGAASALVPGVLRSLGAEVAVLHDRPDGRNINQGCGSTAPDDLQRLVAAGGFDAGLALDGDADRVLAVDQAGSLVDGDQMLAVLALDLQKRGELAGGAIVATVMSNLGLRLALAERGVKVVEVAVGDRHVLSALEEGDLALGGEQSGHLVFRRLATTGDGLLTGLLLLDVVRRRGRPLAELAGVMTRLPQVLRNVAVARTDTLEAAEGLWAEVAAVEDELGASGRVLLRASGTEPLVRVMVEAPTRDQAETAASRLEAAVERAVGEPGG